MTPGFWVADALTRRPKPRKYDLPILRAAARSVTVPATYRTVTPGAWGMFLSGGGHLRVSGTPEVTDAGATWQLDRGVASAGQQASWTGIVDRDPASAGLPSRDHLFATGAGIAPAWVIGAEPTDERPVWAVHIHGMGSSRAGTLRGVATATEVGVPSISVTYRNSEEGPHVGRGRSTLGWSEADDVAAALEQLPGGSRTRFILFGWSMGAQIALRIAASGRWRDQVIGIVLDSPALSWPRILEANATHARIPAWVGRQGTSWVSGPVRSRMLGLDHPVPLHRMDWVTRAPEVTQPVLLHHGRGDWSVPMTDAERFARDAPRATLRRNDGGHTTGWNIDPVGWSDSTVRFVGSLLR